MRQRANTLERSAKTTQPPDIQSITSVSLASELVVDVGWLETRRGTLRLAASPEHRIRVYAGTSIAGVCSNGERHVYTQGDLDLMPAGYEDTWHEEDDGQSLWLGLSPRLLERAAMDLGLHPSRGLHLQHKIRDPRVEHIAWALEAERRSGYENGVLYRESLGLALSLHLLRRYGEVHSARGGLPPARKRKLLEFIEAHLDQDLSLTVLAEVAGVSPSHLKTLFRHSTGQSVHQYVMRQRVERARRLLAQHELSISQIAYATGFAHQSHLARCMRRLFGTTPAVLRGTRGGQSGRKAVDYNPLR